MLILFAGLIGEIVLEILAWGVFPAVLGVPMRPHILVTDLGRSLLGVEFAVPVAVGIHLALGLLIMPLIYVKGRALLGIRSWVVAGVLWGVLLWATAQMVLAPLAGRPFMLGLIPYTWGSLVAHVIYTLVVAYVYERERARFSALV
ncbi:MAG: hypothetical protein D6807_04420 [Alphaproteobacteria bacterium]|nr:MAG: hypothetical protein D6807_04420 [Alphaproteobacteria bacterium]